VRPAAIACKHGDDQVAKAKTENEKRRAARRLDVRDAEQAD